MKEITLYDLLYDFLYTLNGDAYIIPLNIKSNNKLNIKKFLIGHYNKTYKVSDYTKIRDFVNKSLDDSFSVKLINADPSLHTGKAVIDKKVMIIISK